MSLIISGTFNSTYNLSNFGFFAVSNPISITPTGVLTNGTSGTVALYGYTQPWYITNAGLIAGKDTGVLLTVGGIVTNRIFSTISGYDYGIDVVAGVGSDNATPENAKVTNAGYISGTGAASGVGVAVDGNYLDFHTIVGTVINQITGTIDGGKIGVRAAGGGAIVTNAGAISGAVDWGIAIVNGGSAANQSTGVVSGGHAGIYVTGGSGTVTNAGVVSGTTDWGIAIIDGGTVANQSVGMVSGGKVGIYVADDSGTVTNAGSTAGASIAGVWLKAGGSVTNQDTGTISGPSGVYVSQTAQGTVTNAGVILGTSRYGLWLMGGRVVTNQNTGTISGSSAGIILGGASETIANAGTIDGGLIGVQAAGDGAIVTNAGAISGTADWGIEIFNGGTVENQTGGMVSGGKAGIYLARDSGIVTNAGSIAGAGIAGVWLNAGGSLANQDTGIISGENGVYVYLAAQGTVTNAGVISGTGQYGLWLRGGGSVTNQNTGTVSGAEAGVSLGGASETVVNAGTIGGGTAAVELSAGGTNRVIVDPGAVFSGSVSGGNAIGATAISTLELAAGAASGQLSGLGTQLVNFAQLTIDADALWTLDGANTLAPGSTLTNAGVLTVLDGSLADAAGIDNNNLIEVDAAALTVASLSGTGVVQVGDGGTLTVTGAVASTQTIALGAGGVLEIDGTVTNAGIILGLGTAASVSLAVGGTVVNQVDGTISAATYGIYVSGGAGTVTNAGVISTSLPISGPTIFIGVDLDDGGTVVNQSSGTISGGVGIDMGGAAGTVTNAGMIGGRVGAVVFGAGFADRVIVDPGAVFSGSVNGGNTIGATAASTLELASGATQGLISGLGTQFIDFAQVTIDAGALWTLTGANTLAAGTTLTNAGVLTLFDGTLSDAGDVINNSLIQDNAATLTVESLTGTGGALIGEGGTLTLGGTVAATETIAFGGTGLLALNPTTFSGQIDGLGGGGRIELIGITDATAAVIVNANTLAIQQSSGPTLDLTLDPEESYAGFQFSFSTISGVEFLSAAGPAGATIISQGETDTVSGSVATELAANSGGVGGITVTGTESLLTTTTGTFTVGDSTPGTLEIDDGGSVMTSSGAVIANQAGAGGSSVNVTDAEAIWQISGSLDIGNAATGVLAITNGATVSATTLDAGVATTGAGIITVSGPDADLITTGTVSIGDAGSGELSILDGANATIGGDLDIANAGTGTGNVDLEDTTGTITLGGNVWVGYNGFGVFNIGYNVDYIQNNGGINFGPDSSGAINSFADPSPFLSNASPNPIAIGAQGVDQLAAYLFNSGEFTIPNGHALSFETPIIYGGGAFALGSGDTLVLNAGTVSGQTFTLGANDTLTIGIDNLATIDTPPSGTSGFTAEANPDQGALLLSNFGGVIANFTAGDTIDVDTHLASASAGTLSQNGSVVSVIEIANGATLGVLTFDSAANATAAVADKAIVLEVVPCFAAGTRIATARGEVAVEAIGVGERVRVLLGGAGEVTGGEAFAEVIWVGRREVDCARHPNPRTVWPVRVAAGAFGPGRPYAELWLSPDHAVYVEDVLIPIKHLINGSTIVQVQVDRITYHHIELAQHDVVLAEGLPTESFLNIKDGSNYANRSGPAGASPDVTAQLWEALAGAPLIVTGPQLAKARALVARFAAQGTPPPARNRLAIRQDTQSCAKNAHQSR